MSSKKKIYFWLIVFGAIFLFFLAFVIPEFFKAILRKSENLISLKNKLATFQEETKNLIKLEETYRNYQSNLAQIDKLFIDPEVPIEFIKFLEKNALLSQQKIEISLMSQKGNESDSWPSLFFQVSTAGSFPNFPRFLEKLENSPYLITILDLNVRRLSERGAQTTPQGSSPGDVESTLLLKVYTRK